MLLLQALTILEKFETRSAKGAMAVPLFAINHICVLLEQATEKGDCVAPFFLDYMKQKYRPDMEIPDLTLVPKHRARGDVWVEAYTLYLKTFVLHSELSPDSNNILFVSSIMHGKLSLQSFKTRREKKYQQIIDNLQILIALEHPVAYLCCAKLLERFGNENGLIEVAYQRSAFAPNVWGMQEYLTYLESNSLYNPGDIKHRTLKTDLTIIKESQVNWNALIQHYSGNDNLGFLIQWNIHATLHGETADPFNFIWIYIKNHTTLLHPLSQQDAFNEGIKWLYWYASARSNDPDFIISFVNKLSGLLKTIDTNTDSDNMFALHMIHCMYHTIVNENTIDVIASSGFYAWMSSRDKDTQTLCHRVHTNARKEVPLIMNDYHFSTSLALSFEENDQLKLAEKWYRNALRLEPDDIIAQYNVANILCRQNKGYQESIEYYLKAAQQGCMDSFKALVRYIFLQDRLSTQQIATCIHIVQTVLPEGITARNEQAQSFPILPWLYEVYDCKTYQEQFRFWKKTTKMSLKEALIQKKQAFEESIQALLKMQHDCSLKPLPERTEESPGVTPIHIQEVPPCAQNDAPMEHDDDNGSSDIEMESQVPVVEETTRTYEDLEVDYRKQRARETLEELRKTHMRNLKPGDLVTLRSCFRTLLGDPSNPNISTKGRTSGSRIMVDDTTIHLLHGHDRPSPGARHKLKRVIEETAAQIEEGYSSSSPKKTGK